MLWAMNETGQEIELKLQFSNEESFRATLLAAGGDAEAAVRQINHFFDDAQRSLRSHAYGMRLREESQRFFLTAKGKKSTSERAALSVRREEECEISPADAKSILAGDACPLVILQNHLRVEGKSLLSEIEDVLAGRALAYIGAFENHRTRVRTELDTENAAKLPVVLEFDRTCFPGNQIQFELELELARPEDAERAEAGLRALLQKAGTSGRPASGKATRFFAFLELENRHTKDQNLP